MKQIILISLLIFGGYNVFLSKPIYGQSGTKGKENAKNTKVLQGTVIWSAFSEDGGVVQLKTAKGVITLSFEKDKIKTIGRVWDRGAYLKATCLKISKKTATVIILERMDNPNKN